MGSEILAVLPLQYSTVPFSAVRLVPVKVRVELIQEGSLVWFSIAHTPLTVSDGMDTLDLLVTLKSPLMKEPFQMMKVPGSLQV